MDRITYAFRIGRNDKDIEHVLKGCTGFGVRSDRIKALLRKGMACEDQRKGTDQRKGGATT